MNEEIKRKQLQESVREIIGTQPIDTMASFGCVKEDGHEWFSRKYMKFIDVTDFVDDYVDIKLYCIHCGAKGKERYYSDDEGLRGDDDPYLTEEEFKEALKSR